METVVTTVRSGLRNAAPDEVTLEFGIELSLKSGLLVSVVTASGGKATLKVSATWRKNGDAAVSTVSAETAEASGAGRDRGDRRDGRAHGAGRYGGRQPVDPASHPARQAVRRPGTPSDPTRDETNDEEGK
ncbi:CU044_2847 family protein [Streptomyces sp. CA-243310]|uniref:CU044_2847 family protein n=1 Tax=Streptomyces sp. CA-243310 TaxID=3240056 RepID=UPI003D8B87E6